MALIEICVWDIFTTSNYAPLLKIQILFIIDEVPRISSHTLSTIGWYVEDVNVVDTAFGDRMILGSDIFFMY